MSNFNKIKPLSDKIDTLLLSIKDIKPNLHKEYTLVVDEAINGFIDLGADYIEKNPQEFEMFLSKLNDIIKILNFIKDKENISELKLTDILKQILLEEDRCKRIADRKYDKPSAYKSGAIVRCRKGDIWKDLKEEKKPTITPDYIISRIPPLKYFNNFSKENDIFFQKVDYNENIKLIMSDKIITLPQANTSMEFSYLMSHPGTDRYRHSFSVKNTLHIMWPKESDREEELTFHVLSRILNQMVDKLNYHEDIFTDTPEIPKDKLDNIINNANKAYFDFEEFIENKLNINIGNPLNEDESLHKWFKRKGAPGKEGGWVDCNTCRNGKCKPCGRKEGEKRAKYPSCRPTPAQCKTKGKGKKWGKTK